MINILQVSIKKAVNKKLTLNVKQYYYSHELRRSNYTEMFSPVSY